MQCSSYLPGCYYTRDLNVGITGSMWPTQNNDRTWVSGSAYSVVTLPPSIDQYLGHCKEILRQMMLNHEATFVEQVHELHRLYKRQKELMDEIRRRELSQHHVQLQAMQPTFFLSQLPSEITQEMLHVKGLPWLKAPSNRLSNVTGENFKAQPSFAAGNIIQDCSYPTFSKIISKDGQPLSSKTKKSRRRILDLEQPADEYIDTEEQEQFVEERISEVAEVPCCSSWRYSEVVPNNQSKMLVDGSGLNTVCEGGSSRTDLVFKKTNILVDLNEPIQLQEEEIADSVCHQEHEACNMKSPGNDEDLSKKSQSGLQVQKKDIVHDIHVEGDVAAVHLEDGHSELLSCTDEAGRHECNLSSFQDSYFEDLSGSFGLVQPHEGPDFDKTNNEPGRHGSNEASTEPCEKTELASIAAVTNHDLLGDRNLNQTSPTPDLHQLIPCSNVDGPEASLEPSSGKKLMHERVQQIPIAVQALPCFNIPLSLCKGSRSSAGSPGLKGNKLHESRCSKHKTMSRCSSSILLNLCPVSHSELTTRKYHSKSTVDLNLSEGMDLNTMPPSCLPDKRKNLGTTASERKRIRDSVGEEMQVPQAKLDSNAIAHHPAHIGNCMKFLRFGNQIDLNSCINEDDEFPWMPSDPNSFTKPKAEILLEAPVSPENMECSPPREGSEDHQLEMLPKFPTQEAQDPKDELIKAAAKAIVLMSSSQFLENTPNEPIEASYESLNWFANIVTSVAGCVEKEFDSVISDAADGANREFLPDVFDEFEAMTLMLIETKAEERYLPESNVPKGGGCNGNILPSKQRGRARMARQRKDFQTEVLPSLACLSRNEVTEDLQTIGGLMEASGSPIKTGLRRRIGHGKRGRRSSVSLFSMSEISMSSTLMMQPKNGREVISGEGGGLKGWGKKSRRKTVRSPSSKLSSSFSLMCLV